MNLTTQNIKSWDALLGLMGMASMYDRRPSGPLCGTLVNRYSTKPAEDLSEILNALSPDAAQVMSGDHQEIFTAQAGFNVCGEFSFPAFWLAMVQRLPNTPGLEEGPPVEIWSFQEPRDPAEMGAAFTDPDEEPEHGHVQETREDLASAGVQGDPVGDPLIREIIVKQAQTQTTTYSMSKKLKGLAEALEHLHQANPQNQWLAQVFEPFLTDPEGQNEETTVVFNPLLRACPEDASEGVVPFIGKECLHPLDACPWCPYGSLIQQRPYGPWSHRVLVHASWLWVGLHEPETNWYQRVFELMQFGLTLEETAAAQAQRVGDALVDQFGLPQASLAEIEGQAQGSPDAQTETMQALIPAFFRNDYAPCMDPSWTWASLLRAGEIDGLQPATLPCPFLMEVFP